MAGGVSTRHTQAPQDQRTMLVTIGVHRRAMAARLPNVRRDGGICPRNADSCLRILPEALIFRAVGPKIIGPAGGYSPTCRRGTREGSFEGDLEPGEHRAR